MPISLEYPNLLFPIVNFHMLNNLEDRPNFTYLPVLVKINTPVPASLEDDSLLIGEGFHEVPALCRT